MENSDFTALVAEIDNPVALYLRTAEKIADDFGRLTLSPEKCALLAGGVIAMIKHKVTKTPSTNDIREYMDSMSARFDDEGLTLDDRHLIEAYVNAGFGFTGEECLEIDDFYDGDDYPEFDEDDEF